MPTSQFTIYSWTDALAPSLTGQTGSLIALLDACLVNGYGNKVSVGWTHPLSTISGTMACYMPPSGSQMTLFVNDTGPNSTALGEEAWVCGYESMTALTGSSGLAPVGGWILMATSSISYTSSLGSGYGQFPMMDQIPNQQSSVNYALTGHLVWRKSATTDTTVRPWIIMADAYTMYMFVQSDAVGTYYPASFGDIYAYAGLVDKYRCLIVGRNIENSSAGGVNNDWMDIVPSTNYGGSIVNQINSGMTGMIMPRNWSGYGPPMQMARCANLGVMSSINGTAVQLHGKLHPYALPDQSYHVSPVLLSDPTCSSLRGEHRGFYQFCHSLGNLNDLQTFDGIGPHSGKKFMLMKQGPATGYWAMEISPTLNTN